MQDDRKRSLQSARYPSSSFQSNGRRDVRVLLAEDSATIRRHLTGLINETPGMKVIGEARDGKEALQLIPELKPDVVSMDIRMPVIDGLEATRRIMAECPTPVVVVSGLIEKDVELSFQALDAGALAVVEKPPSRTDPRFMEKHRQLIRTLAAMSKVSVVRRGNTGKLNPRATVENKAVRGAPTLPEIIAIGASAGGPSALHKLLESLPAELPVPVIIVQHMPHEFIPGLVRWLEKTTNHQVILAEQGMVLAPGVVHLAPGKSHLRVVRRSRRLTVDLVSNQGVYRYFPAVDVLFQSVAETCGKAAIGIVLTGMGDDGANGLLEMRHAGAHTFAQDQATSTVFGMPAAAIARDAVEQVLPLMRLSSAITKLV